MTVTLNFRFWTSIRSARRSGPASQTSDCLTRQGGWWTCTLCVEVGERLSRSIAARAGDLTARCSSWSCKTPGKTWSKPE